MIGRDHCERKYSEFGEFTRIPESPNCESLMNHTSNGKTNSRENEIKSFAGNGQLASEIINVR